MNFTLRSAGVASAAALTLLLSACTATNETTKTTQPASVAPATTAAPAVTLSGELNGAGASTQEKAMEAWRSTFQGENPSLTINYDPVGSGGGRTAFLGGSAAWAGSDAALSTEEYATAITRCGADGAINLPMYISAIAIAFNLDGIPSLQMDPATVAMIFDGKITVWNDPAIADLNPGVALPSTPITIVHRSDESGTTKNFTDYLAKSSNGAWPYDASGDWANKLGESGQGTSGVKQILSSTKGTIGYLDSSQAGDLGAVAIKVGDAYVTHSPEGAAIALETSTVVGVNGPNDLAYKIDRTTTAAGAYPVMLASYVIVCQKYDDATEAAKVTGFLKYAASPEGQALAASAAGSAPMSAELSGKVVSILEGIATASGV